MVVPRTHRVPTKKMHGKFIPHFFPPNRTLLRLLNAVTVYYEIGKDRNFSYNALFIRNSSVEIDGFFLFFFLMKNDLLYPEILRSWIIHYFPTIIVNV